MKNTNRPEVEVQICRTGVPSGYAVNVKVDGRCVESVLGFTSKQAAMLASVDIANRYR